MKLALLLVLSPLLLQDSATSEAFKGLGGDDAEERKASFDLLKSATDAPTQAQLKKTLGTLGTTWLKKAQVERTRALRSLAVASRKGWNPLEITEKQKALQALLAAGNTKAMEAPVKELWKRTFFETQEADKDEKFAAAKARVDEIAAWQKAAGVPEKEGLAPLSKDAFRVQDETQIFALLEKRDAKIMADNAALRDKLPAPEYAQIWQTNLYRIVFGRAPLKIDAKLCEAARDHSKDMKEKDFFDHVSPVPGKRTVGDRAARMGTSAGGENIFVGSPKPENSFWAWFFSLGHHQNMVRDYATIGVGNFDRHWTQMFG